MKKVFICKEGNCVGNVDWVRSVYLFLSASIILHAYDFATLYVYIGAWFNLYLFISAYQAAKPQLSLVAVTLFIDSPSLTPPLISVHWPFLNASNSQC